MLAEPSNAPLISSGIEQERDTETFAPTKGHPSFTPHPIQGWTPNFIPKITQDGLDGGIADEIVNVGNEEALKCALDLAKYEGIFTGISGGATTAAALKICEKAIDGSGVLAMLPDTMERYLTTVLFNDIGADMNEEEIVIAKTSPNYLLHNL